MATPDIDPCFWFPTWSHILSFNLWLVDENTKVTLVTLYNYIRVFLFHFMSEDPFKCYAFGFVTLLTRASFGQSTVTHRSLTSIAFYLLRGAPKINPQQVAFFFKEPVWHRPAVSVPQKHVYCMLQAQPRTREKWSHSSCSVSSFGLQMRSWKPGKVRLDA